MLVQGREKAIFLTPDQVFRLVAHANAVEDVQVWERDHYYVVIALDQAYPVRKLAVIYEAALATHCAHQFVLHDATLKELILVVNEEAAGARQILLLFFFVIFGLYDD